MPKRDESCRGPPKAIISIAQHARPNVAGHTELLRMNPSTPSTVLSMTPAGSFSSMPIAHALPSGRNSIPVQAATPPLVRERHRDQDDERHHREETEDTKVVEPHRPRVQEDDLDVEDDERHGGQVVLDRESPAAGGSRRRFDTAFVRVEPGAVVPLGPGHGRERDGTDRED